MNAFLVISSLVNAIIVNHFGPRSQLNKCNVTECLHADSESPSAERFKGQILTEVTLFLWISGSGIPNVSCMMVLVFGCAGLYNRRMVNANLCWDKQQIHRPRLSFVCDSNLRMKKRSQSTLKTWMWAYLLPRGDAVRTSPLAVHIRYVLQRGPPVFGCIFSTW